MSCTDPDVFLYTAKDPGEVLTYGLDFTNVLDTGETLSSASVTVTTYAGTDASPSALLAQAATISSPIVYQKITGGLNGVTYRIRFQAATSNSRTLVGVGYLPVDAP